MLQFYYSFFVEFWDVTKFEDLEIDTDLPLISFIQTEFEWLHPTDEERRVGLIAK